ncbi:MAG: CRISPR-associated helicase Cas3' [Chloroherpetonaceae bacterium]
MDTDLIEKYRSHPNKLLFNHLKGVAEKAKRNTPSKAIELACLFHDLGKINPNFQNKLNGKKTGYDNHAYLSAFAWLLFCQKNAEYIKQNFGGDIVQVFSVTAIVARHHSDLPDMEKGFFANDSSKNMLEYILSKPELPISKFFQNIISHQPFSFAISEQESETIIGYQYKFSKVFEKVENPLEFFHDTQFGFACLIEADKRDASDNEVYQRQLKGKKLLESFDKCLKNKFDEYQQKSKEGNARLNALRTEIRNEAIRSLNEKLDKGERIFTLTAPTGSGKTMILFSLANEIIKRNPSHDVLYTLPFLSITEQVETVAKEVFSEELVLRIDSKSENKEIQRLLEESDNNPEKLQELLWRVFSEETFDHPFIITTFVRFFETLVSNKNSELLKLPNFSKRIFLIDEVQTLPPRLYIFFAALLDEFCRRYDSFAVLSTATMPFLEIENKTDSGKRAAKLFKNYPEFGAARERELLDADKYFADEVFNRYSIQRLVQDNFTIDDLAVHIRNQSESCLVVLNTIQDTKDLFEKFSDNTDEYLLLNTHFHLEDRKAKIETCKEKLRNGERVVLISTQLIEAGVDIDFPVLYRDLCPLPSLIQSAGRCNRNGSENKGKVYFFELRKEGKLRAEWIYRDSVGKEFLEFCKKEIVGEISEKDLFQIQKKFFEKIGKGLIIGLHFQSNVKDQKIEMVECIEKARFETLGQFKLIDEKEFGEEHQFYVPKDENDDNFEQLIEIQETIQTKSDRKKEFSHFKELKVRLELHLRKMSERIVKVRLKKSETAPLSDKEVFGIKKLTQNNGGYNSVYGIDLKGVENNFI